MAGLRLASNHDRYNRPQKVFPCESGEEPIDTFNEAIEETEGNISKLEYNTGTENGFILVKET